MNIGNGLATAAVTLLCAVFILVFVLLIAAAGSFFGPLMGAMVSVACVMGFFIGAFS